METAITTSGLTTPLRPDGPEQRPVIGILAGMGPRSTAPFIEFVLDECQRQLDTKVDADFPPMIVMSWPLPFYVDRPIDTDAMYRKIEQGLRWLESSGAAFLAMPCNTAHIWYNDLSNTVGLPIVNMIEVAAEAIPAGVEKVALLATRDTCNSGMYQRALANRGIELTVDEDVQSMIDEVLRMLRAPVDREAPRLMFDGALRLARSKGAEVGLVACTDLNAAFGHETVLPLVDGTKTLAAAVVSEWARLDGVIPNERSEEES